MAKLVKCITPELQAFIEAQHLFFVATAPLAPTGHVNLSPKGLDTFRVITSQQVAYLDLTGSGNETSAHLQENGRITIMFCAFTGKPQILRLYGQGRVVLQGDAEWNTLRACFPDIPGARQIIVVDITRVQTSCGFAVPLYQYQHQRDTLVNWALSKGPDGLKRYHQQKNLRSIDGLPTSLGQRQR
ncbi:MAG: pyridoxamine 5'-phosphate oxidase family protein [Cyanobacteria bacterium]|nr:pyridoxamine 5'-phosphate oxidase family protein [Cyanobacteriota bacterium]MDW8201810.1 pyridoxamine 5'-phosphate oxidase family protein [Cyanobacteriota bacterium SKYGB_h_bin112]